MKGHTVALIILFWSGSISLKGQVQTQETDTIGSGNGGLLSNPTHYDHRINTNQLRWYPADTRALVTAPLTWKGKDYLRLGGAAATVLIMVNYVDEPVNNYFDGQNLYFWDQFSKVMNPWRGATYFIHAGAVPFIFGAVFKDELLMRTSLESIEAQVLSSVVAYPINVVANRKRPRDGGSPDDFHSNGEVFGFNTSFPSGHAILVFSAATAFAEAYKDRIWIPITAYGLATLVGIERLYQNAHFASDVFFGAFVGHFITKRIIKNHRNHYRKSDQRLSISPYQSFGAKGLRLVYKL